MNLEFENIINGCKKGDRNAQGQLYKLFSSRLFAVALYYTKDQTEAEDILHEGFLKIFKYIRQFEGKGSFEGWLKRIIINTALEKFRKKNLMFPVDNIGDYIEDIGYEDVVSDVSLNEMLKMIQDLSPQYRMVFNLFVMEGLSHQEIAELLEISEGTSKSNLSRARSILQDKIKKELAKASKNKMVV